MFKRLVLLTCAFTWTITVALAARTAMAADDDEPGSLTISLRDLCDPPTFNAALHDPNACIRDDNPSVNGSQTFAGFGFELSQEKSVGAWRNNPDRTTAEEGTTLKLINRGGETHTFTRVAKFGGGFVAPLNAASGNPVPAPECAKTLPNGTLVPQPPGPNNIFLAHGQSAAGPTLEGDEGGEVKFECCIHPWMRTTIKLKNLEREKHD